MEEQLRPDEAGMPANNQPEEQAQARRGSKKRGRPRSTDTPFALRREEFRRKREAKLVRMCSLDECTRKPCQCCGHDNCALYPPQLISDLRKYLWQLSYADQRAFLHADQGRCDEDRDRINDRRPGRTDLTHVRIHVNFRLERPEILHQRLVEVTTGIRTRLPKPSPSECLPVCSQFLLWAMRRSTSFLNPSRVGGLEASAQERLFQVDRVRQVVRVRPDNKTRSVVHWLEQQVREHLVMPNAEATVLPYRNRAEAHAAYVMDSERIHNCSWANAAMEECLEASILMNQDMDADLAADDDMQVDLGQDECKANEIAVRSTLSASMSRYGNVILGATSRFPVHEGIAGYSWFRRVWQLAEGGRYLAAARLRKWMPFAKCDDCCTHREAMAHAHDDQERARLRAKHRQHLTTVRRERASYMHRRQQAARHPDETLSLIIDGADASPYHLPHGSEKSHALSALPKVKMHVYGAIAHGRDTYAYTCPPHIAQGHNVTIQVLHNVLEDVRKKEGGLPPVLHLQLDNTTKQNKGRGLVAYLAYLVHCGTFEQIYMNFLPVGHTHEDIDQFFSRISVYSRYHSFRSPDELREGIRRSFKKYGRRPIVSGWDTVANISSWMEPHLEP